MKKVLLAFLISITTGVALQAQCTIDTTLTQLLTPPPGSRVLQGGAEPEVILPPAEVGVAYSAVLQFRVPEDTTYIGQTVTIDSLELVSVDNLPSSMSISCNPPGCTFLGGTNGCLELTGTPTVADSVQLGVNVTLNATFAGLPTPFQATYDSYYLPIREEKTVGLNASKNSFSPKIYPNPASNRIFVKPNVAIGEEFHLQITSVIGRTVYSKSKMNNSSEALELDISNLNPGVYLYTLSSDGKTFTGRFSISR